MQTEFKARCITPPIARPESLFEPVFAPLEIYDAQQIVLLNLSAGQLLIYRVTGSDGQHRALKESDFHKYFRRILAK